MEEFRKCVLSFEGTVKHLSDQISDTKETFRKRCIETLEPYKDRLVTVEFSKSDWLGRATNEVISFRGYIDNIFWQPFPGGKLCLSIYKPRKDGSKSGNLFPNYEVPPLDFLLQITPEEPPKG